VVAVLRERALAGEFGGKGSAGRQTHRDEDDAKTQHCRLPQNPVDQVRLDSAAGLRTATAVMATMKRRTIMALS
jgi:hypothetical protein